MGRLAARHEAVHRRRRGGQDYSRTIRDSFGVARHRGCHRGIEMSFLDVAIRNAGRGFRVFPVHRGSKKPCILNFPDLATTDQRMIEEWAAKFPDANVGVMGDDVTIILDTDRWDKLQELFAAQLRI